MRNGIRQLSEGRFSMKTMQVSKYLRCSILLRCLVLVAPLCTASQALERFNYTDCLFGGPKPLHVELIGIDRESGVVECNGFDPGQPLEPFAWDWGDGTSSSGFFPQAHVYENRERNYVIQVTAHYRDGTRDTAEVLVPFGPLILPPGRPALPDNIRVSAPHNLPVLHVVRAPYGLPLNRVGFADTEFQASTRETVEYVLTQAAAIQVGFANDNVCKTDGRFDQVLLLDPEIEGMYSLWYTDPMGIKMGGHPFTGEVPWSSIFHEMGHNATLNSPTPFHWGFKQDGPANTIYSETMAQIFQHATAYELVNDKHKYGISDELALDIAQSARKTMEVVRRSYESYRNSGCRYSSWNDASTEHDDTFDTFMTIAHTFFEHAERDGMGYREPLRRLMAFLQRFNPEWEQRFSARENSPDAERFRATLMAAALSHAFKSDLRPEFRELNFPIDDAIFEGLVMLEDIGEK